MATTRNCVTCKTTYEMDMFPRHKIDKNGKQIYHYNCRKCHLEKQRNRHKEKSKALGRKEYNFVSDGCKTCSRCNTSKPLSDFYSRKGEKETHSALYSRYCKPCQAAASKEKTEEKKRTFYGVMHECVKRFKRTTKRRQKKHPEYNMCNPDPTITAQYLVDTYGNDPRVIAMQATYVLTGDVNDKPTVDRIDPTKGYTKDNIQIITWRENKKRNGEDWGRKTGPITGPINCKIMHEKQKKPVLQIDPVTGMVIAEFDSAKAASAATGIKSPTISANVGHFAKTGIQRKSGGFHWRFK